MATADKPTDRLCVFCGAPADSNEHLLPKWLQKVLPSDEKVTYFVEIGREPSERREWNRRPFREEAKIVCKGCNTNWMSDLEKAARPVLEGAVQHKRCAWGATDQAVAAAWAFKTSLVFQASQTDRPLAPGAHFAYVREYQHAPPQAAIWVGSHFRARDDAINSVFVQRPLSLQEVDAEVIRDGFGYLCFLAVGGVSFVIVAHRLKNQVEITYSGSFDQALIEIWPDAAGIAFWPPQLMMDREFIDVITLPPGGFTVKRLDPGA